MKKLILLIFTIWPLLLFSQIIGRYQFTCDTVGFSGGSVRTYLDVLQDDSMKGWYIAHADNITETNDSVSQWDDVGGEDNHLLQSAQTNRPVFTGDSVVFDGINDYMFTSFAMDQPTFIYMVIKQKGWTQSDFLFDGYAGYKTGAVMQDVSQPDWEMRAGTDAAVNGLTLNTWGIVRVLFNGASSKVIIDSDAAQEGDFGSNDMEGIMIGCDRNVSYFSNIAIKELIVRSKADSAGDEALIYNYLKDKYGL